MHVSTSYYPRVQENRVKLSVLVSICNSYSTGRSAEHCNGVKTVTLVLLHMQYVYYPSYKQFIVYMYIFIELNELSQYYALLVIANL